MPTIAIVGAGPGLGLSIAKVFGRHGFDVALVSRSQDTLDGLVATLADEGIAAGGFTADVLDRPSLVTAFQQVVARFGPVDVLEYSPAPHSPVPGVEMASVLDVSPENLQPQIDYYLYGAVTAAQQVLPSMIEARSGTLLFTTGGGSVSPIPPMGNVNAAAAALRNWAINLHGAAAEHDVYAAHIAISAWIGSGAPEAEADAIALTYWQAYTARTEPEYHYVAPPPA